MMHALSRSKNACRNVEKNPQWNKSKKQQSKFQKKWSTSTTSRDDRSGRQRYNML
jgi:hypothetical protein